MSSNVLPTGSISPLGLHSLHANFLSSHPPFVGNFLCEVIPLELAQVLEVPHVVVVVATFPSPDEGVVEALSDY